MTTNESGGEAAGTYEVVVVGGGPGGLTTALYTTRLNHETALVDRGGGRAAMMADTHNVIGVPEEVSGGEFLQTAFEQLDHYGTEVIRDYVTSIEQTDKESPRFMLETNDTVLYADAVVIATGFNDGRPEPPLPRTGRGLHYCLQCDGYMFVDEPVYVMGHTESAAKVAMIMLNFTDDVDLLLRGEDPEWSQDTAAQLDVHPVDVIDTTIESKFEPADESDWFGGFEFADGTRRTYTGGFAMYGAHYNDDLVGDLDLARNDDGTVAVDETGQTSVDGIYAVGDITPGYNQIPIAMGEGAMTGIAIHKDLRTYPKSLAELSAEAGGDLEAAQSDD